MNNKYLIPAILLGFLVLSACGEDPIKPEQAQPFVDAWAPTVEPELLQRSEGAPVIRALTAQIEAAAEKDRNAPTRDEPAYDVVLEEVYKAREYKPIFVASGELTPAGQSVWKVLTEVEDHVLDARDYPIARVTELTEKMKELGEGDTGGDLAPTEAEKAELVAFLVKKTPTEFPLTVENQIKLTEELLSSPSGDRLKDTMKAYEERGEKLAATGAELEYLLAHSLARFSYQIRFFKAPEIFIHKREDDYYNEPEIRKKRPDKAKAHYKAGKMWRKAARIAKSMYKKPVYARKNIKGMLVAVAASENPIEVIEAIEPQQPQYRPLLKEYRRYRKIVDDGGWEKVKRKRSLKLGSSGATVRALKERLRKEGYYPVSAPIDDQFDEHLKAAITSYQETHQMNASGKPHTVFWKSLNIKAEKRRDQIRINTKRWRNTNIRHATDSIYAFINVADFHVEIWEDQKRAVRHRVIVGNNDNVKNAETEEMERANRTPVPMAAYIDRVIYNPFWNVTPRVRTNEILPEVKTWLEEKYKKEAKALMPPASLLAPTATPTPATPPTTLPATPPPTTPPVTTPPVTTPPALLPTQPTGTPPPSLLAPSTGNPYEGKPYYNAETGEIDVSTTDPENVPGWYAANDYEVMYGGKKWEYVRMTPGKHNALGFVKIIFPNLHDVYLHDTNARALFSRDIRAYSHGCMRLQDPLDLAEWLLRRDGLYEPADVPGALKSGEYLPIFLKRQVPVFVEYYTVRVDEKGRANFLADVYDYDDNAKLPDPVVRTGATP